jgi:hypothetical protein
VGNTYSFIVYFYCEPHVVEAGVVAELLYTVEAGVVAELLYTVEAGVVEAGVFFFFGFLCLK